MLLQREVLDGVSRGTISLAFRRWRRPTVRPGGTLMTAAGQLQIGAVTVVALEDITSAEAELAGYPARDALLAELARRPDGQVYRIEIGPLGPDPRIALRETVLDAGSALALQERLDRFDRDSPTGPWTIQTLQLLRQRPGVRAGDLCGAIDQERMEFKRNVRKLKKLGLTESLPVGYRLSPRGISFLDLREY